MKTLNLIQSYIILLAFTVLIGSCKKFVEIDPPNNQLVTVSVFTSDETANAALLSIYAQMVRDNNTFPYSLALYTGYSSDELKSYSSNPDFTRIYTNSINSTTLGPTDNLWTGAYSYIYQASAVWEGCSQSTAISSDVKKQLMAEALFIRAYWYFYLVNLFGDVPLLTTTDYTTNSKASRAPASKVYEQIISDLLSSEAALNPNYVAANSTSSTTDRVRPNKAAASALLARIYLYTKNYAGAELEATKVISNSATYGLESTDNAFLKGSREAIWQLMMPLPIAGNNGNTMEAPGFVLTKKPTFSSSNGQIATISDQLLSSFEPDDKRKVSWIGTYTDQSTIPATNYYFPNKFKLIATAAPTEYSMPLRLSEQLLIRAEARAYQSNFDGALADLKAVRDRAGLGSTGASNQSTILAAILHERQVELFTEWGHRWLDLKRTGNVDQVMTIVTPLKGGVWKSTQQLYPLPVKDVLNDGNLHQNPGYN